MTTMKDVAKRAGVSTFTVSNVLNNRGSIRETTRQKVLAAIAELDYRPNLLARSLRMRRTYSIGVAMPVFSSDNATHFFSRLAKELAFFIQKAGYRMSICAIADYANERSELDSLARSGIDGLIIAPEQGDHAFLHDFSFPVVAIDSVAQNFTGDSVQLDSFDSGFRATKILTDKCCARIGYVGVNKRSENRFARYQGYCAALEAAGLAYQEEHVILLEGKPENSIEFGRQAARQLLSCRVDALFIDENTAAIGAFQELSKAGKRLPQDIALIVHDDAAWTQAVNPAVSVIDQPLRLMAQQAAQMLFQRIEGKEGVLPPGRCVKLPSLFIERQTI